MTGFERQTSGIGSDRSANWGTTTAPFLDCLKDKFKCSDVYLKRHLHSRYFIQIFQLQPLQKDAAPLPNSLTCRYAQFVCAKSRLIELIEILHS